MGIPVDAIVLKASGVQVDESAMTGESDHLPRDTFASCMEKKRIHEEGAKSQEKHHHDVPSCVLLSGTNITTGEGLFLVIVVGEESCEGKIQASLGDAKEEKTPLQEMLNIIATDIGKLGMFCAILIFHALVLRNFIEGMVRKDFDLFGGESQEDIGKDCQFRLMTSLNYPDNANPSNLWIDEMDSTATGTYVAW
jgi:magnesium-transporting ATPase (P-type)